MDKYIKKMREVITNSSEKIIGLEKKRNDYKHFLPEYEKEANDKIETLSMIVQLKLNQ